MKKLLAALAMIISLGMASTACAVTKNVLVEWSPPPEVVEDAITVTHASLYLADGTWLCDSVDAPPTFTCADIVFPHYGAFDFTLTYHVALDDGSLIESVLSGPEKGVVRPGAATFKVYFK